MITFLWGFIGALAGEFLQLYEFRGRGKERVLLKSPFYWITFFMMSVIGGALSVLYQQGGTHLSPLLALNVGASAPFLLKTVVSTVAPMERPKVD